jgi:hypothetical protein
MRFTFNVNLLTHRCFGEMIEDSTGLWLVVICFPLPPFVTICLPPSFFSHPLDPHGNRSTDDLISEFLGTALSSFVSLRPPRAPWKAASLHLPSIDFCSFSLCVSLFYPAHAQARSSTRVAVIADYHDQE